MPTVFLRDQQNLFALRKRGGVDETPIELQIQAVKLPAPDPEYPFAKAALGREWRADLAWPEWMILFEIEGGGFGNAIHLGPGSWTTKRNRQTGEREKVELEAGSVVRLGGRHNSGAGMATDCEKYNQAALLGWLVIRATPTMIKSGAAIAMLERAFAVRRKHGYPIDVSRSR